MLGDEFLLARLPCSDRSHYPHPDESPENGDRSGYNRNDQSAGGPTEGEGSEYEKGVAEHNRFRDRHESPSGGYRGLKRA